jgi:hypothetical protein
MITKKQFTLCALLWISTHYAMENSMAPVKCWDDAEQFKGHVVAYTTTAYDTTGYTTEPNGPKYFYVHNSPSKWSTDGLGFGTSKLLHQDEFDCTLPLTNPILTGNNYQMRKITDPERKLILCALANGFAKFDKSPQGSKADQPKNIIQSLTN